MYRYPFSVDRSESVVYSTNSYSKRNMAKHTYSRGDFIVRRARKGAGLGLVTKKLFKKGDFVIEYTGPIISTKEADEKGGRYLFDLNSRWTIDGGVRSNIARYINHSCRPNCEAEIDGRKVYIYAIKRIEEGEELSYDYGKEYFDEYIKPSGCKCDYCMGER